MCFSDQEYLDKKIWKLKICRTWIIIKWKLLSNTKRTRFTILKWSKKMIPTGIIPINKCIYFNLSSKDIELISTPNDNKTHCQLVLISISNNFNDWSTHVFETYTFRWSVLTALTAWHKFFYNFLFRNTLHKYLQIQYDSRNSRARYF